MIKEIKLNLTQKSYTVTDFTIILLNSIGVEVLNNNGKHNSVFNEIRQEISDLLYVNGFQALKNSKRKLLYQTKDLKEILFVCDFNKLIIKKIGYEIDYNLVKCNDGRCFDLKQSRYSVPDFALIVANELGIHIRNDNGTEVGRYKGIKNKLHKMLNTVDESIYDRGLLCNLCDELLRWLISSGYCKPNISLGENEADYNNDNSVHNAIVNILKSDDREIIDLFKSAFKRWKIA